MGRRLRKGCLKITCHRRVRKSNPELKHISRNRLLKDFSRTFSLKFAIKILQYCSLFFMTNAISSSLLYCFLPLVKVVWEWEEILYCIYSIIASNIPKSIRVVLFPLLKSFSGDLSNPYSEFLITLISRVDVAGVSLNV